MPSVYRPHLSGRSASLPFFFFLREVEESKSRLFSPSLKGLNPDPRAFIPATDLTVGKKNEPVGARCYASHMTTSECD